MTKYHFEYQANTHAVRDSESTSFHLGVPTGGYVSLGRPNMSRYQGFAHILPMGSAWELFKTVEDISVSATVDSITLKEGSAERVSRDAIERFTTQGNTILYAVHARDATVKITLDMRAVHDFARDERTYSIQDVPGGHVITYRCPRYSFCLAILGGKGTYRPAWREVTYPYEVRRKSLATLWVYDCLEYSVAHSLELRFGIGWTPQQAMEAATHLGQEGDAQKKLIHNSPQANEDPSIASAYAACMRVMVKT